MNRCLNDTKLKIPAVKDVFTREYLAREVFFSKKSTQVPPTLTRLVAQRGAPAFVRTDNGPEFIFQSFESLD